MNIPGSQQEEDTIMKQIHFDPTNQEAMNALMDEHGKSKTMYPGTKQSKKKHYGKVHLRREQRPVV